MLCSDGYDNRVKNKNTPLDNDVNTGTSLV